MNSHHSRPSTGWPSCSAWPRDEARGTLCPVGVDADDHLDRRRPVDRKPSAHAYGHRSASCNTGDRHPGAWRGRQSDLRARADGLQAIELKTESQETASLPDGARLHARLERLDRSENPPIEMELDATTVARTQIVSLRFAALHNSAGGVYRLTLDCPLECGIALSASMQDSLADAQLTQDGVATEGDLSLTTYYSADLRTFAADLGSIIGRWAPGLLATLLLLGGPGLAGALWVHRRTVPPTVFLATSLTSALAFWPLTLLWTSTVGLSMTPAMAWGLSLALTALSLAVLWRRRRRGSPPATSCWDAPQVTLMVITALAILLRLVQARELLVPAWVDSVHHTMLASLIAQNGVVPISGAPYRTGQKPLLPLWLSRRVGEYCPGYLACSPPKACFSWANCCPPRRVAAVRTRDDAHHPIRNRPSTAFAGPATVAAAVPAF